MSTDVTSPDEPMLQLADGFESLTHEQWQGLAAKALNRGRPEDRHVDGATAQEMLRTHTVDGLLIEPLYEPEGDQRQLGYPGLMPFTRGTALRDQDVPWDVRALFTDADPAATRKAVLLDLERGVTSVWLQIGSGGLAPGDLGEALADVLLDLAPVIVTGTDDDASAAEALKAVWAQRGTADEAARGNFGYDPLARVARTGLSVDDLPGGGAFTGLVDAGKECLQRFPGVRAGTVDVLTYHNAGAGDVEEVGCAIATGIAYLRAFEAAGVAPADAVNQLEFRVAATADQFLTIAKLRALRRLWARVTQVCRVPETARGARTHAVSSLRMTTRDDPWVNILRGTVACFAAAAGGADAITVLPFDACWGLPDVLARRVARNTQIVVADESNLGRVTDPAGGSWYVEELTDQLAAKAWVWVQQIEAAGGMAQALTSGLVAERVEEVAAERTARLATRRAQITGVSAFPHPTESPLERRPEPPGAPVTGAFPQRRDAEPFEALRDRSAAHATANADTPPQVLMVCLGARRDYGAREMFAANLVGVAGILTVRIESADAAGIAAALAALPAGESSAGESPPPLAVLCSSAAVYGQEGLAAVAALREAGLAHVYVAGRATELPGDAEAPAVDGFLYDGIDIVDALNLMLDRLGVDR